MKKIISPFVLCLAVGLILIASCNKEDQYKLIIPPGQSHFTGSKFQSYTMAAAAPPPYLLTVGTTDVTSDARTITFNVTSPTGAVAGTHYTITGNTVTIPAGQATANISIQGNYSLYTAGRKDTLIFTLAQPNITPAKFLDTVKLVLRGPCFEGDVTMSTFSGTWKAIETFGTGAPYGPYNTTMPAATLVPLTLTTGSITVTNIWDNGWGPITFLLDWTNPTTPATRTVTVVPQAAIPGSNGGDFNPAYAGMTVQVRPFAGNPGTFSACNNTFTLRMQLGITGLGFFAQLYTVNLTR